MPSKSKAKGNKFEYDVVKVLNDVYSTEEFSRTPNSGAMMGRSNWGKNQGLAENVKRTLGSDIIVPDWFKFSVECKHYKDKPNYSEIIKGPDTTLDHWLGESVYDAINLNLHSLLFFKTNRKGVHFALPEYFYITHDQEGSHMAGLVGDYFLMYGPFVISGLDTFLENAERIKLFGNMNSVDFLKHEWRKRNDVQYLLKSLDS